MKKVNENNHINKEQNSQYEIFQNDSFGNSNNQNFNNKIDNNNNNINIKKDFFINDIDRKLEITLNYLDLNELNEIFITNNILFKDMLILSKNDMIDLGFNLVQRNRLLKFSNDFQKYAIDYNVDEIHSFFQKNKNLNIKVIDNNNIGSNEYYHFKKNNNNNKTFRGNFSLSPKSKNVYENEVFFPKKNNNNLVLKRLIPNSKNKFENNIIKEYKRLNSPKSINNINKHSNKISSDIFRNYHKIQKEIGNYLENYNRLKKNNDVIPNKFKRIFNSCEKDNFNKENNKNYKNNLFDNNLNENNIFFDKEIQEFNESRKSRRNIQIVRNDKKSK